MPSFTTLLTRSVSACFLLLGISVSVSAQKLPEVQKISLRAPANAQADGKTAEWGNRFQAHNNSTGVWYTIANDDEKLYFVIHAEDVDIIHKMMRGCVTITINTSGKKDEKNAASITFPTYLPTDAPNVSLSGKPKPIADTVKLKMKNDSFMMRMNPRLVAKQKFIALSGIKLITDSLISVYNELGIEAKAILDNQLNYNYELAIPLKYLGLVINKASKFSYNIRLNGITPKGATFQTLPSGRTLITFDGITRVADTSPRSMVMNYPNDFWGEYTLAKKQ
jgi:hypothetical protein